MNDWIEWKGGDMPVDGETIVNVRYSSRYSYNSSHNFTDGIPVSAKVFRWEHIGSGGDIIAYRLHKDA